MEPIGMDWCWKHVSERPNQQFINELTFKEVGQRIAMLCARLSGLVEKERRVAILATNSVDTALFFLALVRMGKEVVMLNTRLTDVEIEAQLRRLQVSVVFSNAHPKFLSFSEVWSRQEAGEDAGPGALEEGFRPVEPSQDDIVVIMNTSASTGTFKSVPLRWKQIRAHVEASARRLGVTDEDHWLLVLPLFHIGGLAILLRSLYNGTRVTLLEKFREEGVLELIETGGVNMLSLVPTLFSGMVDKIRRHRLRVVLLGGEFIPAALVEKCMKKGIPLYKTYGMTETTSQSTTFSVLEHPDKYRTVGPPLDGVEIRIHEPDEHGVGEVLIKSEMLMDGYLDREPVNGYFHTEDVGFLDGDNFLTLLDRRQNIIISGGENIYPKEIENILYEHPDILECAVVGKPDPTWGKVPVLYVVSSLSEGTIRGLFVDKLAKYKIPKAIHFLDQLPKDATGKILRKQL